MPTALALSPAVLLGLPACGQRLGAAALLPEVLTARLWGLVFAVRRPHGLPPRCVVDR